MSFDSGGGYTTTTTSGTGIFGYGAFAGGASTGTPAGREGTFAGLITGIFGKTWHAAGSGSMAARGQAAYAAKIQRLQAGAQLIEGRRVEALRAFEATSPSGVGAIDVFNPDPKVQKLGEAIQSVKGAIELNTNVRKEKKLLKKQAALEAKQERRMLKTASQTQVRVAELYGPNAGYWYERGTPPPLWLTQRSG